VKTIDFSFQKTLFFQPLFYTKKTPKTQSKNNIKKDPEITKKSFKKELQKHSFTTNK
jgi:hypothetical protein